MTTLLLRTSNYSAEELLDAPGAIYKDIELYHYTGKRKRSNESIRANDHVMERKGKCKEQLAVEEAPSKKPRAKGVAGPSKWTVPLKAWNDPKVPVITHELELVEAVYIENPDKEKTEQADTDEAGLAEGMSQ
ncbi:hypothetical protein ZTR_00668 [Talaromyces verruculosus]|nr:hypothetical protein ZTR_00668 [Talaromyces verruculosus]